MKITRAEERGGFNHGWLKTQHTFSFGDYYNPEKMGYRSLRVINEDFIEADKGFPTHGHRDMEIITYIIKGALAHKDSTGGEGVIRPGEVQRMTAGRGIRHSEFNYLKSQDTHLLQIWLLPHTEGLIPGYEQKNFADKLNKTGLHLVASTEGREHTLTINQDVDLYVGKFGKGDNYKFELRKGRGVWLQVVSGTAQVNGEVIKAGDGLEAEESLNITCQAEDLEFLLFDLS